MKKYTLLLLLLASNHITASQSSSSSSSTPSKPSINNQLIDIALILEPSLLDETPALCAAIEMCRTAFKQCHEAIMDAHIECEKIDDAQQKRALQFDIVERTRQSETINQNFGQLMNALREQLARERKALAQMHRQLAEENTLSLVEVSENLMPLLIQEREQLLQAKKSRLEQDKATLQEHIDLANHTLGISATTTQTTTTKK